MFKKMRMKPIKTLLIFVSAILLVLVIPYVLCVIIYHSESSFCLVLAVGLGIFALLHIVQQLRRRAILRATVGFAAAVLGLILVFSLIYLEFGLLDGDGNKVAEPFAAIYFSIVTWTTLGYGDLLPTEQAKGVAAAEAILGYTYMGLFVVLLLKTISDSALNRTIKKGMGIDQNKQRFHKLQDSTIYDHADNLIFGSKATWILTGGSLTLLIVHLLVPGVKFDTIALALVLIAALPFLLPHLKNLKLPGGIEIELKEIKQATERAAQIVKRKAVLEASGHVATEEEARAQAETLATIANLREVTDSQPGLAVAGFRIELEKRLRELAERHQVESKRRPLFVIARKLTSTGLLPKASLEGLEELVSLGNRAAHGAPVDRESAYWILDAGLPILNALDSAIHGAKNPIYGENRFQEDI